MQVQRNFKGKKGKGKGKKGKGKGSKKGGFYADDSFDQWYGTYSVKADLFSNAGDPPGRS